MRILVNASNLVVGGGVQKAVQFVPAVGLGRRPQLAHPVSPEAAAGLTESVPARRGDRDHHPVAGPTAGRRATRVGPGHGTGVRARCGLLGRRSCISALRGATRDGVYRRLADPSVPGLERAADAVQPRRVRLRLWYYECGCDRPTLDHGDADRSPRYESTPGRGPEPTLRRSQLLLRVLLRGRASGVPAPILAARSPDEQRLLVFTSYKPHKNLEIIPHVAACCALGAPSRVRFVFTLPDGPPWRRLKAKAEALGVGEMMLNVGPVPAFAGPSLYAGCDALFMPTVLETFTANYPEAMAMDRPIITSDLDFAHDDADGARNLLGGLPRGDVHGAADRHFGPRLCPRHLRRRRRLLAPTDPEVGGRGDRPRVGRRQRRGRPGRGRPGAAACLRHRRGSFPGHRGRHRSTGPQHAKGVGDDRREAPTPPPPTT